MAPPAPPSKKYKNAGSSAAMSSSSSYSSSGNGQDTQVDQKTLWKKFYDLSSHLGVYKREQELAGTGNGTKFIQIVGPYYEFSSWFKDQLDAGKAIDALALMEKAKDNIFAQHGYTFHYDTREQACDFKSEISKVFACKDDEAISDFFVDTVHAAGCRTSYFK